MQLLITFQTGEFYFEGTPFWTDFIIGLASAGIGTLTALIIFRLTIKAEKKKQKELDKETNNRRIHYFISLVEGISIIANKQSAFLAEFQKLQHENFETIPKLKIVADYSLRRFVEMANHEDYYHAYLGKFSYSNSSVEKFREIFKIIDFLQNQKIHFEKLLEETVRQDNQQKAKYKAIVDKVMTEAATLINTAKQVGNYGGFEDMLNTVLLEFHAEERDYSKLSSFEGNFVTLVKHQIIENFRDNEAAIRLVTQLKEASQIYHNIEYCNSELANDFEAIYLAYNQNCEKLNTIVSELKSVLG